ncbi:unnamed protein product [Paramecium sonneborni]|uniref:VWFA domain-containing protein n=1 Tax=Paramecium sonneborni TaxID=65129 RepID=A0A8S1QER2_9CILI|nr:unnamed protein product [Paramecium sonneborni]
MNGCSESCPLCKSKCDLEFKHISVHQCQNGHQLRGMNGVLINDSIPSLFSCEEIQDGFQIKIDERQKIDTWKQVKEMNIEWKFRSSNTEIIQQNKEQMMTIWNSGIGQIICNQFSQKFNKKNKFTEKSLNQEQNVYSSKTHHIFMLDSSESMAGQNWTNVKNGAIAGIKIYNKIMRLQQVSLHLMMVQKYKFNIPNTEEVELILTNLFLLLQSQFNLILNLRSFLLFQLLFYTDGQAEYPLEAIQKFQSLPREQAKKIELIACTEEQSAIVLTQLLEALKNLISLAELKYSVTTCTITQVWQEVINQQYHKIKC